MPSVTGLHHVTAVCADAVACVDFYTRTLAMRMVKVTVNFDDPGAYHLYFGDAAGTPGSVLTFFEYPSARRGIQGRGQVAETALAVPPGSLAGWIERLQTHGVPFDRPSPRFGAEVVAFDDPDGLKLSLVEEPAPLDNRWSGAPLGPEAAIHGFHHVSLCVGDLGPTRSVLEVLGFASVASEGARHRFRAGEGTRTLVDVVEDPDAPRSYGGHGAVHHVALAAESDSDHVALRQTLLAAGLAASEVMERVYFRSVYAREPGGVLLEIATRGPGFLVDETVEQLGSNLRLPPWLEAHRERIAASLTPLPGQGEDG